MPDQRGHFEVWPKGQRMKHLTQHDCNRIAKQLNTRPSKRLGYRNRLVFHGGLSFDTRRQSKPRQHTGFALRRTGQALRLSAREWYNPNLIDLALADWEDVIR